jgi:hypothetical protein
LQTSDALGAAAARLGPDAQAAVVELNKQAGLSHGKVSRCLKSLFGIPLSVASCCACNCRLLFSETSATISLFSSILSFRAYYSLAAPCCRVTKSAMFTAPFRVALAKLQCDTVVYTPPVANTPGQIEQAVGNLRYALRDPHVALIRQEEEPLLDAAERKLDQLRRAPRNPRLSYDEETAVINCAHAEANEIRYRLATREHAVKDPTALIVIDEADRLKMAGLEQVRDIFDHGGIGLVLIGMPGIEKRLARYPQLYSRVGFVHEYRPLTVAEVRGLLQRHWRPAGVVLPEDGLADEDSISSIIRVTGGNFRLLHRLLTQIARVLEINDLEKITLPVVQAARESLVIGTA